MTEPEWKPCPRGCRQGMVREVDPHDPSGESELPVVPQVRYRCQDCDRFSPAHLQPEDMRQ